MEEKDIIKDFGSIKVPSSWSEITLKNYQEIEKYYEDKDKEFNVLDVLDILIDKDRDYINSLPAEFLDTILTHLLFLVTTPDVGEPSNKIVISGETYTANIAEKLRVGEYVAIDTLVKDDAHNYAALLAVLFRKKDEKYDSHFENEVLEDRIKMFEEQPVTKILPLVHFFINCYTMLEIPILLSSKVKEAINLTAQRIESLHQSGEVSKRSMRSAMKKLKKLEKSINSI